MGFSVEIDIERCKGCGLCVEVCARKLLAMSERINSAGAHFAEAGDQDRCSGCLHCAIICPDAAIEVELVEQNEG